MESMQRNTARAIVAIALLICFVCPVMELFDYWDHTIQTGNDTEYTLVVLALCIGIVFAVVRLAITILSNLAVFSAGSRPPSVQNARLSVIASAAFAAASSASPPLNLRI